MKCSAFVKDIHNFMNRSLPPKKTLEMQKHLEHCRKCDLYYLEYSRVKDLLSERHRLPRAATQRTYRRVLISSRWNIFKELALGWDWLRIYWRDLDSRFIWSKIYAVPLTSILFALILLGLQFGVTEIPLGPDMNFLGVNGNQDILDHKSPPPSFRNVAVRQSRPEINRLVRTAWEMPYEDSLFVVAEITPEGNAEIGRVLEYPRNERLLDAVDVTLQQSQFEQSNEMDETLVLVSFYKIDVREKIQVDPYLQYRMPN
jgi:hypothetical protein